MENLKLTKGGALGKSQSELSEALCVSIEGNNTAQLWGRGQEYSNTP